MAAGKKSRSYRDLKVWKRSVDLAKGIYEATSHFPPVEKFALRQQIKSAAVPIPSTIAEGQFRNFTREFRQSLSVALGSAAEEETRLIIADKINYLSRYELNSLLETQPL